MAATEQVILVDKFDQPLGCAEKMQAHREGLCHRAFSILLYRNSHTIEVLIQQRAPGKYHSPNLWTNTCCSHPRPGELTQAAAERRLFEELGITVPLTAIGTFHYIAHFENGLTENEVDHVFIGKITEHAIMLNPEEVQAIRWITLDDLAKEITLQPETFTPWLPQVLQMVKDRGGL